jgi:catecholate siderophore receptor
VLDSCPCALRPVPAALATLFMQCAPAWAQQPVPPPVQADAVMPEVTVEDQRIRETGYRVDRTRIGKTTQDLRDVPNSVAVVPEQLIFDRGADSLRDALRNVAGVTFNAGEGGRIGDNITVRGYSAVGDLFLDGMRNVAQYNREVFNLDRIEVLRGSASMLFGRGSTGGIINQVSKTPQPFERAQVALTYGSNDYKRATLDLNHAVDQETAVRLNAIGTDTDSFRDVVQQKRDGVAPALTLGLGGRDELTLAYMHLHEDNIPDFGVPYFQGRPLAVPVERFYGMGNADYERNTTDIATAVYTHRFAPGTEWRTQLRHADYERDLWAVAPRLVGNPTIITDATAITRQRQARGGDEQTWTVQSDLSTRAQSGMWRHEILAGVEYARETATRWTNVGAVPNPATTVGDPDPFPPLPPLYFTSQQRANFNSYDGDSVGAYAQDYVEFRPGWKLLLGARWDQLMADYDRPLPAGDLSRDDSVWSWRGGLVYQPDEAQSYYFAYGTSFNPSAELYQLDDRTANTPPEKNRNIELGAKWDLLGSNLAIRSALFRSQKSNERNTDLSIPDVALLSGKRHTDGIEVEWQGASIRAGKSSAAWPS